MANARLPPPSPPPCSPSSHPFSHPLFFLLQLVRYHRMCLSSIKCVPLCACSCCVWGLFCADGNGSYVFSDVELVYSTPGLYQLVVVADSIASELSEGVIEVRFKGSATTWEKVQSYLIVSGLFLLVGSTPLHSWVVCVAGMVRLSWSMKC